VRGKKVLDFAAGAGLVAIAASKSGALSVDANEIDDFALAAIALNAQDNGAEVSLRGGDLIGEDGGWDVVLAGDIAYERDMTARVFAWLHQLARRGATVLIGDPGRAFLPKTGLQDLAEYRVPTTREIEDTEIKRTKVFKLLPG
jgi:predicted nicotinamide N-methyase